MQKDEMRLCLGTVQFGSFYGVHNSIGRQPSHKECFELLRAALKLGINTFDTASVYGNAEEILGDFFSRIKGYKRCVRIISKLNAGLEENPVLVIEEVKKSLKRLHADSLYGYMLHSAEDMKKPGIVEGMLRAREMGLVEKIGVSIYEPEDAMQVARDGRFDIIQVPYNVLDHRLESASFFEIAEERGLTVYARSIFLQGLLLMKAASAEQHVCGSGDLVENFREIAFRYGYTPEEACLLYALWNPKIDFVVFGVDTLRQLEENVAIRSRMESFGECYAVLKRAFFDVPREVLVPALWK